MTAGDRQNEMATSSGTIGIMPQDIVSSPYPLNKYCKKYRTGLAKGYLLLVRNCLCALCDWFPSLDLQRSRHEW